MSKWHSNESPLEHTVRLMKKDMPNLPHRLGEREVEILRESFIDRPPFQTGDTMDKCFAFAYEVHVAHVRYGRPCYLVSKELYETISEFSISDEDCKHVFEKLPYPCFSMVFERGIPNRLRGELQSIFILRDKKFEFLDCSPGTLCALNTEFVVPQVIYGFQNPLEEMDVDTDLGSDRCLFECAVVKKLAAALLMLWRARPEFVAPVKLPKADRYLEFSRGDLKLIRTWKFPDKLIVRKPQGESDPTGRHVKAHWRAGHFRHYRNERFAREPDGSVKVEFIAPCMIHADELTGVTP